MVETTGAWGLQAQKFLSALIRKLARSSGLPVAEVSGPTWGALSMALARSTAGMLTQACSSGLQRSPTQHMASLSPPIQSGLREGSSASTAAVGASVACAVSSFVSASDCQCPAAVALAPTSFLPSPSAEVSSVAGSKEAAPDNINELKAADSLDPTSPSEVLEILVALPSGSVLPVRGPPGEPLRLWKSRLLAHCGIDPAREYEFGLALGIAPLDDNLSAASCDLQTCSCTKGRAVLCLWLWPVGRPRWRAFAEVNVRKASLHGDPFTAQRCIPSGGLLC